MVGLKDLVKELSTPSTSQEQNRLESSDINKLAAVIDRFSTSSSTPAAPETMKKIAEALRQLAIDYDATTKVASKRNLAEDVVAKMIKKGSLAIEDVITKISELETKSEEDLKVLSMALDLNKFGSFGLGVVSDTPAYATFEGLNSKDAMHMIVNYDRT